MLFSRKIQLITICSKFSYKLNKLLARHFSTLGVTCRSTYNLYDDDTQTEYVELI